jgi:hypothetical protein
MGRRREWGAIAVEQMYTPHQVPWTVDGATQLLCDIARSDNTAPFYTTIDTGHQCAQQRYLRPTYGMLKEYVRGGERCDRAVWLGPPSVAETVERARRATGASQDALIGQALDEAAQHPHLFASYEDGDPYEWLEHLGCYSPIVHLQQTDGTSSSHKAFTAEHNARGIIDPAQVLQTIACSYDRPRDPSMPPPCEDIYLTLEVFSSTADTPAQILSRMRQSAAYWRTWIPQDGLRLDSLIGQKENAHARTAA